jgi:hypothetical protein
LEEEEESTENNNTFEGSGEWYLKFLVMASCCKSRVHLQWYGNKVVDYPVHHK